MEPPLVRIRDFSYRLGGKEVLRDVSFDVARGDYLAIVGPNGAGKTTLLKCLVRILRGGRGTIELGGRPLAAYRQKELARLLGYVPQADGRLAPFTVEQFALLGRYPYLSPFTPIGREDRRAVRAALDETGTAAFADRPLGTLSGGERQKVYIAAALAQGADALLLDEPTTFLDYRHQLEIRRLLLRLNRRGGTTIVVVTHDLGAAALDCRRIAALRDGVLEFIGTPSEIMRPEVLGRIYATPLLLVDHPLRGTPVVVPQSPEEDGP
jgi:iron complex transport system ATP-binding protein